MASTKKTSWSEEMKLCMWLCHQAPFKLNGPNTGKVINDLYRNVFAASGRAVPIPYDAIGAIYRERKKPSSQQLWANIVAEPQAGDAGAPRRAHIQAVKDKISQAVGRLFPSTASGRQGKSSFKTQGKRRMANRAKTTRNKHKAGSAHNQVLEMYHRHDLFHSFVYKRLFLFDQKQVAKLLNTSSRPRGLPVLRDSPLYQQGGQIHRTLCGELEKDLQYKDIILCDKDVCPDCGPGVSPLKWDKRLPFVHVKDLFAEGRTLVFNSLTAAGKEDAAPEMEEHPRLVRFADGYTQEVMVCDGTCDDCMFHRIEGYSEIVTTGRRGKSRDKDADESCDKSHEEIAQESTEGSFDNKYDEEDNVMDDEMDDREVSGMDDESGDDSGDGSDEEDADQSDETYDEMEI